MSQSYSMVSGDSKSIAVGIVDATGAPVDVSTAASIRYEIAASVRAAPDVSKSLGNGVTVDGSTVTVTLEPADTAALAGVYYHELQVTDAGGRVFTALSGYVIIAADLIV